LFLLEFMPCHRQRERSLVIKGHQFPLCYRCMAILLGIIVTSPIMWFLSLPSSLLVFPISILLNIPLILDGVTQAAKQRQSNNSLRFVTGIMSGGGLALSIVHSAKLLVTFIVGIT
jgi:uncharacterized membrane protein